MLCIYNAICIYYCQPNPKTMGEEGVEPSWAEAQQILSLSCMPFHHSPREWGDPRREPESHRSTRFCRPLPNCSAIAPDSRKNLLFADPKLVSLAKKASFSHANCCFARPSALRSKKPANFFFSTLRKCSTQPQASIT